MKDSQRIGNIMAQGRYKKGKSQEYMALEMGVSKNTIVNWEKGTSSPKINQFFEWFDILGINQHRPLMDLLYPEMNKTTKESTEELCNSVTEFIKMSGSNIIEEVAYILVGSHGSDPIAITNLLTAYLHLPMYYRISIARSIMDDYDICAYRNELVQTDQVMPDSDMVNLAIDKGKQAAMEGLAGYATTIKEDKNAN